MDYTARYELWFESGERSLEVQGFESTEVLHAPYELTILAHSVHEDLHLDDIVGKPAALKLHARDGTERAWSGVCARMEIVRSEIKGRSAYRVTIVPRLWLLSQKRNHRIFQHESLLDVAKKVLKEWGIKPVIKCDESAHKKREYVVQWGEDDLHFISRVLEETGITFFFAAAPMKAEEELILADKPHTAEPRPGLPLIDTDNPDGVQDGYYVHDVVVTQDVRSGRRVLRDFDLRRRPDAKVFGDATPGSAPETTYEIFEYSPGAFLIDDDKAASDTPVADARSKARIDDKEGKALAERRGEAERMDKFHVAFRTNAIDLTPGTVFSMAHPHPDAARDKKLFVNKLVLHGGAAGDVMASAESYFAKIPHRPRLVHKKPRVKGPQSAIVVGPKGKEIHVDELGRVRVRFHWDRGGEMDDTRTCWLRVSQHWAGMGFGWEQIPRVNEEVLVDFFEGDPDQPIVVGRLFNATAKVPYPLPANKTRSTWKSDTSPHASGFNEILFEDAAGKELVFMQAQKNLQKLVKVNETETTGANRASVVGANRSTAVGVNDSIVAGKMHSVTMAKPKDLQILKMGTPDVKLLPTKIETVDKKIILTTGDATITLDGPTITVEAKKKITISAKTVSIKGGPFVYVNCTSADAIAPITTGLGADADRLMSLSPHLVQQIQELQRDGWKFVYGTAGGGSFANRGTKTITVDANERGNPTALAQTMSHEVGHAKYTPDAYTPPSGLTRQQYVDQNTMHSLKDEGEATLNNAQSRQEILRNGGPDIGIAGANPGQYDTIYQNYAAGNVTRDQAREQIGTVFGTGEHTSNTGQAYGDYYGDAYRNFWDTNVTPGANGKAP